MTRSLILFAAAALAEIGGAWLIWQGGPRAPRLGLARRRGPRPRDLRIRPRPCSLTPTSAVSSPPMAACSWPGRSLWGMVVDGFKPDRFFAFSSNSCSFGLRRFPQSVAS